MVDLYAERTGGGGPVLLLLHGLGLHAGTWAPLIARLQPGFQGAIIAPDLRGHGRSPQGRHYGYGQHASDVAALLDDRDALYVVGHSMGGAIALALASGLFGVRPQAVFAFSTKVSFDDAELARARAYAAAPARLFGTREEAAERFLKVSGLQGLAGADSALAGMGVAAAGEGYRLAADPRTVLAAVGPPLADLHARALCPVVYGCGQLDSMVDVDRLRSAGMAVLEIPDTGHNPQVENAPLLAAMLLQWLKSVGAA